MKGKVIDVGTRNPVSGVNVVIFNGAGTIAIKSLGLTSSDGSFDFEPDPVTDFAIYANMTDPDNRIYFFADGYNFCYLSPGQVSGTIPIAKTAPKSATTVKAAAPSTGVSDYYKNLDYSVELDDMYYNFDDYLKQQTDIAAKPGTWLPLAIMAISVVLVILFFKKILKWSVMAPILVAFTIVSCSSVKKVNKDEKKQLSVIENFSNNHPVRNDTSFIRVPGDTVYRTVTSYDTIGIEVPGDVQYKDKILIKTITITKSIVDTVREKITDRSLEYALQHIIIDKNAQITADSIQVERYKASRLKAWVFFAILLLINTAYILKKLKVF